jgi:hypothetical protein
VILIAAGDNKSGISIRKARGTSNEFYYLSGRSGGDRNVHPFISGTTLMRVNETLPVESDRSCVDWPAIFAGSAISAGVGVVLTTFAAGLGLGSVSIDEGGEISVLWLVLTALFTVISMVGTYMLGGYIAGRMRRPAGHATRDELTIRDGISGLAVWGIGTFLTAILTLGALSGSIKAAGSVTQTAVQAAGSVIGGTAQGAGQLAGGIVSGTGAALGGAGQAAAPTLQQMPPQGVQGNPIDYFVDRLFRVDTSAPATAGDEAAATRQAVAILGNLLRTGDIPQADRDWLAAQVSARTALSQSEAQTRVSQNIDAVQSVRAEAEQKVSDAQKQLDTWRSEAEQAAQQAKDQALAAAEKAQVTTILSAFLLAASALVAAAAAYIGAVHGGRHRDKGRIWGGLAYRR